MVHCWENCANGNQCTFQHITQARRGRTPTRDPSKPHSRGNSPAAKAKAKATVCFLIAEANAARAERSCLRGTKSNKNSPEAAPPKSVVHFDDIVYWRNIVMSAEEIPRKDQCTMTKKKLNKAPSKVYNAKTKMKSLTDATTKKYTLNRDRNSSIRAAAQLFREIYPEAAPDSMKEKVKVFWTKRGASTTGQH